MRWFLFLTIMFFLLPAQLYAQNENLDVVSEPICFMVRNSAEFTMYGTIVTAEYTRPDGVIARHRSNFTLQAADSYDEEGYPADRAEFCSYGPFFEGRKLELSIRTLFPVFSCQTRIDQGEIVLSVSRREDDTGYSYFAKCFE